MLGPMLPSIPLLNLWLIRDLNPLRTILLRSCRQHDWEETIILQMRWKELRDRTWTICRKKVTNQRDTQKLLNIGTLDPTWRNCLLVNMYLTIYLEITWTVWRHQGVTAFRTRALFLYWAISQGDMAVIFHVHSGRNQDLYQCDWTWIVWLQFFIFNILHSNHIR